MNIILGISIKEFNKFGHNEDGPLELELKYDLIIDTDENTAEKVAKDLNFDFVDTDESGNNVLTTSFYFASLNDEDVDYEEFDEDELSEAEDSYNEFIEFANKFVKDSSLNVTGLSNEEKFSKGIVWGPLGYLERVVVE